MLLGPAADRLLCMTGGVIGLGPLQTNGFGLAPGRDMLDLERIMGAIIEDPAACVVFERFMGRLWSCKAGEHERGRALGPVGVEKILPAGRAWVEAGCRSWRCGASCCYSSCHCWRGEPGEGAMTMVPGRCCGWHGRLLRARRKTALC
jgi:hypothetical protein